MEPLKENVFKLSNEGQEYEFKFGDWRDQWCSDSSIEACFGRHDTFFDYQVGWGKYFSLNRIWVNSDIIYQSLEQTYAFLNSLD